MKQELKIYFIASEFYNEGHTFGAVPVQAVDIYEECDYAIMLDVVEVEIHDIDTQSAEEYVLRSMERKLEEMQKRHAAEEARLSQRLEEYRAKSQVV